uniref:Cytochrome b n=1 Tax=Trybliographa sp. ZJUH 20220008 TaxID=2943454 RepID=A0A9E8G7Q3_9HYME|nr:cytochrome b [Trybliographa sp. ZJUH 20220008]
MMKMSSGGLSLKKEILFLPTPLNINLLWNFGSLLGMCLMVQIISGLFLSMHYNVSSELAFSSVIHIIHDVNNGWVIRLIHMNGASFFFMFLFMHIGRGIYFNSFNLKVTWLSGSLIFLVTMGTAFLGYVLPWGQMSFWGATVITNLVSAIPFVGMEIVYWLWGGFSVSGVTLGRFYSLHFILPFLIVFMVLIHLLSLHVSGSSNPLGVNSNLYKVPFHNYFTIKDIQLFLGVMILLLMVCCLNPYVLGDPENFNMANSMVTPIHIQPEWYFLFAYAILRSIPNKLGGVIALFLSVSIIMILPFLGLVNFQSMGFYPVNQILFWFFVNWVILLTWIGMKPIDYPYVQIGQILTLLYFIFYLFNFYWMKFWDHLF